MEVETVMHMTGGEGDTSYAQNTDIQMAAITKAKPFVEDTVIDLYTKTLPKCLTVVDLGCATGPPSLRVISEIIDAIDSISLKLGRRAPEFQVFLNDLPGNDFNTIFKSLPDFVQKLKKHRGDDFGNCFISGTPGSFYGRLFPAGTLDFVHSSYSLQILSQVPPGIQNKGSIYPSTTSPPTVLKAYFEQFQKDWKLFLSSRSEEIVPGGRMVITVIGRRSSDPYSNECCHIWNLLSQSLRYVVSQGLVEEAKLDSFNWPGYFPYPGDMTTIIEEEGSFHLDLLETFDVHWDTNENRQNRNYGLTGGQYLSKVVRSVTESMLVGHFGENIIEDVFLKYATLADEYVLKEKGRFINLVMCMTKKK